MKRLLLLAFLILGFTALPAKAQTQIQSGPTNPATCNPGAYFYNTTLALYQQCGPANTWGGSGTIIVATNPATCTAGTQYYNSTLNQYFNCLTGNILYPIGTPNGPLPTYNVFNDNFTRPNFSTLGANWTAESGATSGSPMLLSGNAATPSSGTNNAASFWSANTFSPNHQSCGVISGIAGTAGFIARASPGDNYYRVIASMNGTNNLRIDKVVAGTFTALTGAGLSTPTASGNTICIEANGSTITAFVNGLTPAGGTVTDNSLTSGAPGITAFLNGSTSTITNWRGSDLVWTRQGTVIAVNATNTSGQGNQEPRAIYEGGCLVVVATNCFKMWFTDAWVTANEDYGESTDGVTWSVFGQVMTGGPHGFVAHIGSTYVAFQGNGVISTGIDRWSSSDGVHSWTKTNTNVLPGGAGGTWDVNVYNPYVWYEAPTCYMLYEATGASIYSIGLATSQTTCDVATSFTKYAGNPVLTGTGSFSGPELRKINGTYYLLAHTSASSNLPSDLSLFSSADLHTWQPSAKNLVVHRETSDEGAGLAVGQLADPSLLELPTACPGQSIGPCTYLFDDATAVQASGNIHINLRTAPYTIAQIFQAAMGATSVVPGVTSLNNKVGAVTITANDLLTPLSAIPGPVNAINFISNQGTACTNAELALSAGWQSTGSATVTAVQGLGQTCSWTITTGTTTAANPTVTDTLTNALPAATTVCYMNIYGGTHVAVAGESLRQTTLSATAPIFTANFTPTAGGTTYFVTRACGP